jgi:RNA polymerase sigma factor (sigma-70 family)
LAEIVRRHQRPIYRFFVRLMANAQDAEDATAELFVRVWKYARHFRSRSRVTTWLYKIAMNLARDAHGARKSRPQSVPVDDLDTIGLFMGGADEEALQSIHASGRSRILRESLLRLSPLDRFVLVLYTSRTDRAER